MHLQLLMVSQDVIPPEIKDYAPKHFCVVHTPRCVQGHEWRLKQLVGHPALESESLTKPGVAPGVSKPNSYLHSHPQHWCVSSFFYLIRGFHYVALVGLEVTSKNQLASNSETTPCSQSTHTGALLASICLGF